MKLSVITINRNNAEGLRKTIQSVLSQTNNDFEYIIIDGASTDGSVDVIKELVQNSAFNSSADVVQRLPLQVRWISEPDGGIYNAMNKGIQMASGDYVLFMNSGDSFDSPTVIEQSIPYLDGDFVAGRVNFISYEGVHHRDFQQKVDKMTLASFLQFGFPHQATFIRRELFLQYHLYDESLRIVSDWKFDLEMMIIHNCSYMYIPVTIATFENDGISSLQPQLMKSELEQAFHELFPERVCADYDKWLPYASDIQGLQNIKQRPILHWLYRALVKIGKI